MNNLINSRNLYKLIISVFLVVALLKIKTQLVTLNDYNKQISNLNQKIATLKEDSTSSNSEKSKEENEDMARKELKMYYPNETPYAGY